MTVPGRHHPDEFQHLVELFPRVLFGIIAGLGLAHTVFQERNGGVHLAPLAFRHDDTKRLHHVLQSLEAVAPITDDMHPANHAPGDELARLVETFDRLTSRSLLISSASSGLGETNSKA